MAVAAKTPILDLTKYLDRRVRVKFQGGRELEGALKGYDQLVNLVLDESVESLRDPSDPYKTTGATRTLGLVICRGVQVCLISPVDGSEEIANPFVAAGDGGDA
jgi:U6 snRNA-associated Sm-like protein LSm7